MTDLFLTWQRHWSSRLIGRKQEEDQDWRDMHGCPKRAVRGNFRQNLLAEVNVMLLNQLSVKFELQWCLNTQCSFTPFCRPGTSVHVTIFHLGHVFFLPPANDPWFGREALYFWRCLLKTSPLFHFPLFYYLATHLCFRYFQLFLIWEWVTEVCASSSCTVFSFCIIFGCGYYLVISAMLVKWAFVLNYWLRNAHNASLPCLKCI